MKKYKVIVILEECYDDEAIENGECEENVDFAETVGIFNTLKDAAALIRKIDNYVAREGRI